MVKLLMVKLLMLVFCVFAKWQLICWNTPTNNSENKD